MSKPGLLTLTIKDKSALYLAYMPFVENGGLFIPTNSSYKLGDEVFMLLSVMGEQETASKHRKGSAEDWLEFLGTGCARWQACAPRRPEKHRAPANHRRIAGE